MAELLWKRGTTLGQGGFGVVSLASTIIHCDIKPDNILLVGTEETAKIADFGLSMTFEQAVEEKRELMIRGTKRYMAPELVRNYDYGPHVDIWALGCTVYELITGTPLWDGAFEEPKFQNSKLSKEAKDFLKRCLVKNPSSRWTADVLLNHPFLQNSFIVVNTAKTRKKKSGSKSLLHKPIRKITFKFGNHKFVRQLPDLKEVARERNLCKGTDK
ncbi:hypothetical protein MTR67_028038 [Solanum verrucosum]|uniref:Protein kinase domain-containing protein n=1 Tax=Solanum verrucosum TaxID=315347 RepID=A0AAF0R5X3_SOLVR|nr:hypothetical protein MTR67_028038 [Solanum verrucosum]